MAFFLFILVNATLFLRPAELVPEWQGASIYETLILLCLVTAAPEILAQLTGRPLSCQPITVCVFGILAAAFLAHLPTLNLNEAWRTGFTFIKVVIYYVLFVSLVNTPVRVRRFVVCLVWLAVLLTTITILQFHEVITLPTFKPNVTETDLDPVTLEPNRYTRLQGSGSFSDPNEFGVMLVTAVPLALYLVGSRGIGFLYLLPIGLFCYGLSLTRSRGALLAFLGGIGVYGLARYGGRRSLLMALVAFPIFFVFFAGRQTSLSAVQGTGQTRIQMWSDWLEEFRVHPVLGKGMTIPDPEKELLEPAGEKKLLAHNSFLQGFADLGFFGGLFFLGAFFFALMGLHQLRPSQTEILDPELARLRPFLMGAIGAFVIGMLSLSLCYFIPTYLVLGLAMAFVHVAVHSPRVPALCFDQRLVGRLAVLSIGYLAAVYTIVRLFVRWS